LTILDYTQLSALLAVERTGSFERAGKLLNISAIGISRRVAKIERRLGVKLLDRKPTRPTKAGFALCRHAEHVERLEYQLLDDSVSSYLQCPTASSPLKIAIPDQGLSQWFSATVGIHRDETFDIVLRDPDQTRDLMKAGQVVAGISDTITPVHGFKSFMMGSLCYRAVASPIFTETYFGNGLSVAALRAAPAVRFNNYNDKVLEWIETVAGEAVTPTLRSIPCETSILEICIHGTAWAVVPDGQARSHLKSGTLVDLAPDEPLRLNLYWQVANALVDRLAPITNALREANRDH